MCREAGTESRITASLPTGRPLNLKLKIETETGHPLNPSAGTAAASLHSGCYWIVDG